MGVKKIRGGKKKQMKSKGKSVLKILIRICIIHVCRKECVCKY